MRRLTDTEIAEAIGRYAKKRGYRPGKVWTDDRLRNRAIREFMSR
jgi:hypothetical protein